MDIGTDSLGNSVAGMYLNAAGNEIEVPFIRRLAEFGLRGSENTRQTFRGAIGLEGTFSNGFDWDHTIHMDFQIGCNTVALTMQRIWLMPLMPLLVLLVSQFVRIL